MEDIHQETFAPLQKALDEHGGLFLGETHGSQEVMDFLIAAAPQFKAMGVENFYVEFLNHEDQALINDLAPNDPELLEKLIELIRRRSFPVRAQMGLMASRAGYEEISQGLIDNTESGFEQYASMFAAYIKNGIRLVGLEDLNGIAAFSYSINHNPDKAPHFIAYDDLVETGVERNRRWKKTIVDDRAHHKGKYIILAGRNHSAYGTSQSASKDLENQQQESGVEAKRSMPNPNFTYIERSHSEESAMAIAGGLDVQLGIPTVLLNPDYRAESATVEQDGTNFTATFPCYLENVTKGMLSYIADGILTPLFQIEEIILKSESFPNIHNLRIQLQALLKAQLPKELSEPEIELIQKTLGKRVQEELHNFCQQTNSEDAINRLLEDLLQKYNTAEAFNTLHARKETEFKTFTERLREEQAKSIANSRNA